MPRLVRMDHTGHTTVAEWTAEDAESVAAARRAFQGQLEQGCLAVVSDGPGHARAVRELPVEEPLVILRRPIAGG